MVLNVLYAWVDVVTALLDQMKGNVTAEEDLFTRTLTEEV